MDEENRLNSYEILKQAFKHIFKEDWETELRDFEHGFNEWYNTTIYAINIAIKQAREEENDE